MKKYLSFFRIRFNMGIQYRTAAAAGIVTQFFWGGLTILLYRAFYQAEPEAFPMTLQATCTYIWMQQAFLALFASWAFEHEIFEMIRNGNVAYEMCRPLDIYTIWFTRSVATRCSRALLRCMPILFFAALLPKPYRMTLPPDPAALIGSIIGMILGLLVAVSVCMLVYILTFFTITPDGVRMVAVSTVDVLSGAVIPLPFFPDSLKKILEILPFGSMQNVPYRIYSGDIAGNEMLHALGLQLFWVIVLITAGRILMHFADKKVVVQGG